MRPGLVRKVVIGIEGDKGSSDGWMDWQMDGGMDGSMDKQID